MLIIVIFILVAAVILSWTLIKQRWLRYTVGLLMSLALISSITILTLNFTDHFGMEKVTTSKTSQIYSAGGDKSPAGILIAKEIGTKSDRYVLIYSDKTSKKATAHFTPNNKNVVNAVKKHATYRQTEGTKASVTIKTTRWKWKNKTYKNWLNVGAQAGELYKQSSTVKVPKKTWLVLTPEQMQKLQKVMQQQSKTNSTSSVPANISSEDAEEMAVNSIKQQLNQ